MVKLLREINNHDGTEMGFDINMSLREMIRLKNALAKITQENLIDRDPILNKIIEDFDGFIISIK